MLLRRLRAALRQFGLAACWKNRGRQAIYRHLAADEQRTRQITADFLAALRRRGLPR